MSKTRTPNGERPEDAKLITDWREWLLHIGEPGRDRPIALDLETTGLSPWNAYIAVIGLYDEETNTCAALHFPRTPNDRARNEGPRIPEPLIEWLSSPDRFFVGHNVVGFDLYFLHNAGVDIWAPQWFDTLIGEGVTVKAARRDVRVNLKSAYKRRLGKDLKKDIDHRTWQAESLTTEQLEYVKHDIVFIPLLRRAQLAEVAGDSRARAMELEQELLMVVARMVVNGLPVDKSQFRQQVTALRESKGVWEAKCREKVGNPLLNLNSPKQLKEAFAALGAPVADTTAVTLANIRDHGEGDAKEFAGALLQFKMMKSRSNMYTDEWIEANVIPTAPDDYRGPGHAVHARYWQVGTDTGRFSSSDPNLQQVAADLRTFFGRIGNHWCATLDYSQLEVRIAAWLAKDEALLEAVEAEDVHTAVAAAIFGVAPENVEKWQRKLAKAGTFTFLFGGGAHLFHQTAVSQGSEMTLAEAKEFEAMFFQRFAGLGRTRMSAYSAARNRSSISITMPHGLIRTLAGDTLKPTTIMNTCVQGSAASGLKRALILCKEKGIDKYLAGTVHDEIIFIAPEDDLRNHIEPQARMAMEQGMLDMFPGEINGRKFPVKVGSDILAYWAGPGPLDPVTFEVGQPWPRLSTPYQED